MTNITKNQSFADIIDYQAKSSNSLWEVNYYINGSSRQKDGYIFDCCIEMYYNDQDRYDGLYEIWYNRNDVRDLDDVQKSHMSEQILSMFESAIDQMRDVVVYVMVDENQPDIIPCYI